MNPGRYFKALVTAIISLLAPLGLNAAEQTYAIVAYGYPYTAGDFEYTPQGYFIASSFDVANGFRFEFNYGGSSKAAKIVESASGNYGLLYATMGFDITPFNGKSVKKVRIATVNDKSEGFYEVGGNALKKVGSDYVWSGDATSGLKIRVAGADGDLGFHYIEVTYDNAIQGTDPNDPTAPTEPSDPLDPSDPTDPTEPSDPVDPSDPSDPTEPSDPADPAEIGEVTISPSRSMISPSEGITISCPTDGVTIYYTTDGSRPTSQSRQYRGRFTLSLDYGMEVRAIAVSTDGQTSEARRQYYFDEVTTIGNFFLNNSVNEPVDLRLTMQLIYKNDSQAYFADISDPNVTEFLLVDDHDFFLSDIQRGNTIGSLYAYVGETDGNPSAVLASAPRRSSAQQRVIVPDTVAVSRLQSIPLNSYVAVIGEINNNVLYSDDKRSSIMIDRSFLTLTSADRGHRVVVTGFAGALGTSSRALRAIKIEEIVVSEPDDPEPGDDKEQVTVSALSAGPGRIDIFSRYNSYVLTPEGAPLTNPAAVTPGDTVYVYVHPEEGGALASIVAGASVYLADDARFIATPYGAMLPVVVKQDMAIVATFVAYSALEDIEADGRGGVYVDLYGRVLGPGRPSTPGVYIYRSRDKMTKIFVR